METTEMELDAAWKYYTAAVESTSQAITETARFRQSRDHRAQAYNSLLNAAAMSYNFACLSRTNYPRAYGQSTWSPFYSVGGPSANFLYGGLFLDGGRTYRVIGRIGDLKLFLMQAFNRVMGVQDFKCLGNYDCSQFEIDTTGRFEVILSAATQPGNWIPLDPDSDCNFIMVRRIFDDWNDDHGDLDIRLVGEHGDTTDLDEPTMVRRLILAADILKYNVTKNQIGFYEQCLQATGGQKNVTYALHGNDLLDLAGSPTSNYAFAVYELQTDEALIIEMEAPQTAYWELHLYDVWLQAPDFTNHQSDVNQKRTVYDSDGKVRVILSHEDPGFPNWLDTVGRTEGLIVFRNYRAKDMPDLECRLVKLSEVHRHLPSDASRCTPEQRAAAIAHRRSGLLSLYK